MKRTGCSSPGSVRAIARTCASFIADVSQPPHQPRPLWQRSRLSLGIGLCLDNVVVADGDHELGIGERLAVAEHSKLQLAALLGGNDVELQRLRRSQPGELVVRRGMHMLRAIVE